MKRWKKKITASLLICTMLFCLMPTGAWATECDQIDEFGNHKIEKTEYAATCTEDGYVIYSCSSCGYYDKVELPGTAFDHEWDDGKVAKDATCGSDGEMVFTCLHDSSHTKTEVITATGKHKTYEELEEATCQAPGHKKIICKVCGEIIQDEECPKLEHEYLEDGKCKYCGKCKYYNEVSGCHEVEKIEHEATCTEPGYVEYIPCPICGYQMPDEKISEPLGHIIGDIKEVYNEATCTEKGNITYYCSRCKAEIDHAEIAPLGHDFTGSISEKGAEGHVFACKNGCGEYGGLAAHNFGEWSAYDENGVRSRICSDCLYTETETRNNPTDPTDPTDPTNPENPTEPSTPTEPTNPATPSEPSYDYSGDYDIPTEEPTPATDAPTNSPTVDAATTAPEVTTLPESDVPLAQQPQVEQQPEEIAELTEIANEDVPLAELPVVEEVALADEAIPLADVPKTGDSSLLWLFVAAISGLGGLSVSRKRA